MKKLVLQRQIRTIGMMEKVALWKSGLAKIVWFTVDFVYLAPSQNSLHKILLNLRP